MLLLDPLHRKNIKPWDRQSVRFFSSASYLMKIWVWLCPVLCRY